MRLARLLLGVWLPLMCLGVQAGVPIDLKAAPVLEKPSDARFEFGGAIGGRLDANIQNWLLSAPSANPSMLQIFRDRDRPQRRDLVPWAGEFAGKYLISAVQALRISRNAELETYLKRFVADLIRTQDADGYLGPFPKDARMTGPGLWDLWGQYHVMLGLYSWSKLTGDPAALDACRKCADYFCSYFLDGGRRVVQAGSEEMNESSIHIFTLLYESTGEPRYLRMAKEIEKDWETPPSGDYVRAALDGKPFYQMPKPRWEGLHAVQAIAELYFITGDEKYRTAFTRIWKSILAGDVHNTGGFSSGEQATGNPYDPRPIETCCTIAWMCISIDYLRMTGDPLAADQLELSTWNAVLGAQSPTGRWWTYNTPMDGERKASAHEIVFQARAGSPELNCCSVNGPRGLGMLSEWAVMESKDGIALNYYGNAAFAVRSPRGKKVEIRERVAGEHPGAGESSEFPNAGRVVITIAPEVKEHFTLRLRIPGWSRVTRVFVNGERQSAQTGTYLLLERDWQERTEIEMEFDMHPRLVRGEREAAGKGCIYIGPVLMAYDPRLNSIARKSLPAFAIGEAKLESLAASTRKLFPEPAPILARDFQTLEAPPDDVVTLCDFATAGAAGNSYTTWLPIR